MNNTYKANGGCGCLFLCMLASATIIILGGVIGYFILKFLF